MLGRGRTVAPGRHGPAGATRSAGARPGAPGRTAGTPGRTVGASGPADPDRASGTVRDASTGSGRPRRPDAAGGARRGRGGRRRLARRARVRRWVAAALAGVAAFVTVSALSPTRAAPAGVPTVVAARALPGGATITQADLAIVERAAGDRPETALSSFEEVVGRTTAAPIPARDVLTLRGSSAPTSSRASPRVGWR